MTGVARVGTCPTPTRRTCRPGPPDNGAPASERQAARELTAAAAAGVLTVGIGDRYALQDIAKAHDQVDAGGRGRVLVAVP
ncbi:hypothetical protein [Streptomyces aureus]|uniref:Uncharacterized protein n=1 Tax=Streptomyces aureus TaxID=193461 RepID=A0ABV4SLL2_9ACTN